MSQWNFSPLSFGWLHQARGYHALTRRPTETMSCPIFSSGPLPEGLQTSFSAFFHSEILAFLLPPQQLTWTWGGAVKQWACTQVHSNKSTKPLKEKTMTQICTTHFSLRGGLAVGAALQIAHCVVFNVFPAQNKQWRDDASDVICHLRTCQGADTCPYSWKFPWSVGQPF